MSDVFKCIQGIFFKKVRNATEARYFKGDILLNIFNFVNLTNMNFLNTLD
jgi:hypothetical protein